SNSQSPSQSPSSLTRSSSTVERMFVPGAAMHHCAEIPHFIERLLRVRFSLRFTTLTQYCSSSGKTDGRVAGRVGCGLWAGVGMTTLVLPAEHTWSMPAG